MEQFSSKNYQRQQPSKQLLFCQQMSHLILPKQQLCQSYLNSNCQLNAASCVNIRSIRQRKSMTAFPLNILSSSSSVQLSMYELQCYTETRKGIRNFDCMENQDVILTHQINDGKILILGIFDGHGQHGKMMASTAKTLFVNFLKKYQQQLKSQLTAYKIQAIIRKTIQKTNSYLLSYKVEQAQYSGTTALISLINNKSVYVFNIGNSKAVLGKHYSEENAFAREQRSKNNIEAFELTHDHTIERLDQRQRILNNKGVIRPFTNSLGEDVGPNRIWVRDNVYPGTFLTRVLGLSCSHKIGVNAEPEISCFQHKPTHKFLVIASDGFWNVNNPTDVIKALEPFVRQNNVQIGLKKLINQTVGRWKNKIELMDDISIIVVPFKYNN